MRPAPRTLSRLLFVATSAAALALTEPALAEGVLPTRATPAQRDLAQSRFLRGKELQSAGKHEEAIAALTESLDVVASPNTRLVIGRSHRELGQLVAAYRELGRAAADAKALASEDKRYEKTAVAADAERAELATQLGLLEISVANAESETKLVVSGEEVRPDEWNEPVPVMPGESRVRLETPGREPVEQTVKVEAGQKTQVSLDAASATATDTTPAAVTVSTTDRSALRPYAFVAGGVALAGLGTFVVAGLMANGTHSDLESACGAGPCPPERADDVSAGRTQQTVANVGLVVFALGAAAGVTLFVLSKDDGRPKTTATSARIVAKPSFVSLEGTF